MDFKKIIEEKKDEILLNLQKIIQIPSVLDENDATADAPFGRHVRECLDFMLSLAKQDGFEVVQDGGYAGHLSYGNENGKLIGILCHLDVVPVGDGWLYPPFSATITKDNKLYGRGSTDDKGPTMAAYYALKIIKDLGLKLKNNIRIIFGCDEETGWRGISHYLQHFPHPDLGFVPDADFPLIYGEKGRMSFDLGLNEWDDDDLVVSIMGGERYNVVLEDATALIKKDLEKEFIKYAKDNKLEYHYQKINDLYELKLKGVAAHAMEPNKGVNAGTHMCNFLKDYSNNKLIHFVSQYFHLDYYLKNLGLDYNDYEMGPITCNLGIVNIVKDNSRVTLDLRYPTRYDRDKFLKVLDEKTKENKIVINHSTNKNPHYVSPEDDLVKKLYQVYLKHTSDFEHKPFTIGGGTYASTLPKAVAFGMKMPYEEELAHQRNEYLNLDTFYKAILIYIDAIIELGELDA